MMVTPNHQDSNAVNIEQTDTNGATRTSITQNQVKKALPSRISYSSFFSKSIYQVGTKTITRYIATN